MFYSLKNKIIVVTGGSGGIGSAIVNKLLDRGAKVVSVFCNHCPFEHLSENIICIRADLTQSREWDRLISFVQKQYGKIDVLINCSGYLEPGDFLSLQENEIKKMIETNFYSVIIGIHKTLKVFQEQGSGHIINIGSLGGIVPMPYSSVYSATKFALRGFTLSLSEELKRTGIDVSLISPGSVLTKMLDHEAQNENTAIAFVSKPLSPVEVAKAVIKVMYKPKIELILPASQSIPLKILSYSPFVYSKLYQVLHKIGIKRKQYIMNRYSNFELTEGVTK